MSKSATNKRLYTNAYTGLVDGIYRYTGYAVDRLGLASTTGRTIKIDTIIPTIVFTGSTPANNARLSGATFTGQIQITELNFGEFDRSRNGTNYNLYDSGLVLMYNFDNVSSLGENASTVKDASQYANNGTINGATFTSAGKYGGAYSFDGNDYIGTTNYMGSGTRFTVSTWIYLNVDQTTKTIFSNYSTSGNGWVLGISDVSTNKVKFYLGGAHLYSNATLANSTWYHVAITYDNGNPKIYINGQLDNNSTDTIVFSPNYYGNDIGRLGVGAQYFNGRIDEVRAYNRALSPTEISQLYKSNLAKYDTDKRFFTTTLTGIVDGTYRYTGYVYDLGLYSATTGRTVNMDNTPPALTFTGSTPASGTTITTTFMSGQLLITENGIGLDKFVRGFSGVTNPNGQYNLYDSGLVAMYNFDNIAALGENGTTAKDSSQYNNTGTINGATYTGNGKYSGAYSFNGTTNYISIPSTGNLHPASITAGGWIKFNPGETQWMLVNAGAGGSAGAYYIYSDNLSSASFVTYSSTGVRSEAAAGYALNTNTWYHIIGTYDVSTKESKLYINGNLVATKTGALLGTNTSNITIGDYTSTQNGYRVNGSIDEVRIYNRALSSGEIDQIYKSNLAKTNTGTRKYDFSQIGMIDGVYSITAQARDELGNYSSTGRTFNIALPDITFGGPTGFTFASVWTASFITGTLEEKLIAPSYFRVDDPNGTDNGYYMTLQSTGMGTTGSTISSGNMFIRGTGITLLSGTTNPRVFIATGTQNYVPFSSGAITLINRINGTNNTIIGRYGNLPRFKIIIPPNQKAGTYEGTVWIDLIEN